MQHTYDTEIDIDVIFKQAVFAQETNNIHDEQARKSLSNSYNDSTQGYSCQSNFSLLQDSRSSLLSNPYRTSSPDVKKRRGRRPLRPNDPIRKKTEEKDKYWLRAFRAYMKENYQQQKTHLQQSDRTFWDYYLSAKGKPSKGNEQFLHSFLSYGKQYKNFLFSNQTFINYFRWWFNQFGESELRKRCEPGSDRWYVFFNYAAEELQNYTPNQQFQQPGNEQICEIPQFALHPMDLDIPTAFNYDDFLIEEDPDFFSPILQQNMFRSIFNQTSDLGSLRHDSAELERGGSVSLFRLLGSHNVGVQFGTNLLISSGILSPNILQKLQKLRPNPDTMRIINALEEGNINQAKDIALDHQFIIGNSEFVQKGEAVKIAIQNNYFDFARELIRSCYSLPSSLIIDAIKENDLEMLEKVIEQEFYTVPQNIELDF